MGAVSPSSSLPPSPVLLLFMTFLNVCASVSDVISYYRHGNTTNPPSQIVGTFDPTSLRSACLLVVVWVIHTSIGGGQRRYRMSGKVREFQIESCPSDSCEASVQSPHGSL